MKKRRNRFRRRLTYATIGFIGACVFALGMLVGTSFGVKRSVAAKVVDEPKVLNSAELAWGEKQLREMISDCPAMKDYVQENDPLWNWAVRQFAGENTDFLIEWNDEYPQDAEAVNLGPWMDKETGYISVNPKWTVFKDIGQEKRGDELWAHAVAELVNITNYYRFMNISSETIAGRMDKTAYVLAHALVEHEMKRVARDIYRDIFEPLCEERDLPHDPWIWYADGSLRDSEELARDTLNVLAAGGDYYTAYHVESYEGMTTGDAVKNGDAHHYFAKGIECANKKNRKRALMYYSLSRSVYEKFGEEQQAAKLCISIGYEHYLNNEPAQALRQYLKAEEYYREHGLEASEDYAMVVLDMGLAYEMKGEDESAGKCYRRAYEAYEKAGSISAWKDNALGHAKRLGY